MYICRMMKQRSVNFSEEYWDWLDKKAEKIKGSPAQVLRQLVAKEMELEKKIKEESNDSKKP